MDSFGKHEPEELEELSAAMLEDFSHFLNTSLPPLPFDPNKNTSLPPLPFDPNNYNDYVDLSELFGPEMAKDEENAAVGHIRVRYFTTRTNVGTQLGNNGRNWAPRRRSRRVSTKETCSSAEKLKKSRIASRQWYEKKKARSLQMEAEIKRLREENATLKKLLQPQPRRKQLQRTVSAPI